LGAVRTLSLLDTACLPRVDIATLRARAAARAVLLLDAMPGELRTREAVVLGAAERGAALRGDGTDEVAGTLRVACCCDCGSPALPPADIARRRASASSLLLLVFALCAIAVPDTCTDPLTPVWRQAKPHGN